MSIDWTKPLVVAGTDRAATVERYLKWSYLVSADWDGDGRCDAVWLPCDTTAVTNAPPTPDTRALVRRCNEALGNVALPTPKLGPEHIEALAKAMKDAQDEVTEANWCIDFYAEHPDPVRYQTMHRVLKLAAEQRAARLAEIRAYLESL